MIYADSLDLFQIIMSLEEEFDLKYQRRIQKTSRPLVISKIILEQTISSGIIDWEDESYGFTNM